MQNTTKTKKKLQLTTETVTKLRDGLTEDQLKAVVGGATCDVSTGSKTAVC